MLSLALAMGMLAVAADAPATASTPNSPDAAQAASVEQDVQRPFHEIRGEMTDLLREEALAKDSSDKAAAVHKLVRLFRQIQADPRYEDSDTLKQYKFKIFGRLTRVKAEIERKIARDQRLGSRESGVSADPEADAASAHLSEQLALVSMSLGGPAKLFNDAGGAFGGAAVGPDYGPDLVDLIQSTIRPSFWDVNGGPGTIVYYRPLRVLVISATSEVHGRVGGLVGGLRDVAK